MVKNLRFICVLIGINILLVNHAFDNVGEAIQESQVNEVVASWWGLDPEDSTEILQAAIDSGAQRVIVPNMGQDWVVRPIRLRSNLELVFQEGVVVTAKKGAYLGRTDSVLNGRDVENVIIRGYGAKLRMHKNDYRLPPYTRAEWRTGIDLRGVKNVKILGLTIQDTGGDGIYLGRGSRRLTNEDVVIRDVVSDNNYRQGISVITARNLLIENSVFKNTEGTPPQAGIDFEPNRPDEIFENIVVRNSIFDNNRGAGIIVHLNALNKDTSPSSVLIENVLVRNNSRGISVSVGSPLRDGDAHTGEIIIRNCIVDGSRANAFYVLNSTDSDTFQVTLEDCYIVHGLANPTIPYDTEKMERSVPIHIVGEDQFTGVRFNNVVVVDDVPRPVFYAGLNTHRPSDEAGIYDIVGDLRVFNPYGTDVLWGAPTKDLFIDVEEIGSVVVPYDELISHPEYWLESQIIKPEPTIHIKTPSSILPETVAAGIFTAEVHLLGFPEDDVRRVEAFVNDDSVYTAFGSFVSATFEIDTRTLHDGRHEFGVKVYRESEPPIERKVMFVTRNFETINEFFRGPHEVAWFGEVYNPIVIDQSSGWAYATDREEDFFGDADRKFRGGNTTEFLTWEVPKLHDLRIELYAQDRSLDEVFLIEVTDQAFDDDDAMWRPVDFWLVHEDTSESGWHKFALHALNTDPEIQFVRLTLLETAELKDIHLGYATFRLLRK